MFWSIHICIFMNSVTIFSLVCIGSQWCSALELLCCTVSLLALKFSSPDIQRDWHHCVEDDDIGPEWEEGREQEVVYRRVPGQIALKQGAHLSLPHCVTHSQDHTHTHQEAKDLTETQILQTSKLSKCIFRYLTVASLVTWAQIRIEYTVRGDIWN